MVGTEKETPAIIRSTFGWQMMGMLVADYESTLARTVDCLKQTSSIMQLKYELDDCPCLDAAAEIRRELTRSQSAETILAAIPKVEALSAEIKEFLNGRLAVFEQDMLSYGDGPAAATLRNARHRLMHVRNAVDQMSQAIVCQMNAVVSLQKANKLPLDGRFL